ncbi:hypothetical protein [Sphingobium herbicidovorans]
MKPNEILFFAQHLAPDAAAGVDIAALMPIAEAQQNLHGAVTAARRVIDLVGDPG